MHNDYYVQVRADRNIVEAAAARLRSTAIREAYDGAEAKHVAFAMSALLDEIARHLGQLEQDVRTAALECSAVLTDGSRRP